MSITKEIRVSAAYSCGAKVTAESGDNVMVLDPERGLWDLVDHAEGMQCETELEEWNGEPLRLYVNRDGGGIFYILRDPADLDNDYYANCDYVDIVGEDFTVIAWGPIDSCPDTRGWLIRSVAYNEKDWYVAFPVVDPNNIGEYKPFVLDALNKCEFWHPAGWDGSLTFARRPTEEEIDEGCVPWNGMFSCEREQADFWVSAVSADEWEQSKKGSMARMEEEEATAERAAN